MVLNDLFLVNAHEFEIYIYFWSAPPGNWHSQSHREGTSETADINISQHIVPNIGFISLNCGSNISHNAAGSTVKLRGILRGIFAWTEAPSEPQMIFGCLIVLSGRVEVLKMSKEMCEDNVNGADCTFKTYPQWDKLVSRLRILTGEKNLKTFLVSASCAWILNYSIQTVVEGSTQSETKQDRKLHYACNMRIKRWWIHIIPVS